MSNFGYARSAADLAIAMGQARAHAERARVGTWASAIQSIPQNVLAFVQARDQRAAAAEQQRVRALQTRALERDEQRSLASYAEDDAIKSVLQKMVDPETGRIDWAKAIPEIELINPAKADTHRQRLTAEQREIAQYTANFTGDILSAEPDQRPVRYQSFRQAFSKLPAGNALPAAYDENAVRDLHLRSLATLGKEPTRAQAEKIATRSITVRNPDGTETVQIVEDTPGQTFTSTPTPDKPNQPVERLVDGRKRDVVWGADGNWYFPGDLKKPIAAARVRPVPDRSKEEPDDPLYARDRQEYLDYVRVHNKQQEDLANQEPMAGEVRPPYKYQPPMTSDEWRVRAKGRGAAGAPAAPSSVALGVERPTSDMLAGWEAQRTGTTPQNAAVPVGPGSSAATTRPSTAITQPAVTAPSMPKPQANTPAATAPRGNVTIGAVVMYQGKRYRVKGFRADGQAALEPLE